MMSFFMASNCKCFYRYVDGFLALLFLAILSSWLALFTCSRAKYLVNWYIRILSIWMCSAILYASPDLWIWKVKVMKGMCNRDKHYAIKVCTPCGLLTLIPWQQKGRASAKLDKQWQWPIKIKPSFRFTINHSPKDSPYRMASFFSRSGPRRNGTWYFLPFRIVLAG